MRRSLLSEVLMLLVAVGAAIGLYVYYTNQENMAAGMDTEVAAAATNGAAAAWDAPELTVSSPYPQSLLDLLERNPETEAFVMAYPAEYGKDHEVSMDEYVDCSAVPLFLQWDQRWGYLDYGDDVAGITGCGPVCLSMAAFYVTKDASMSPDRIIQFALENGYYVPEIGSSWTLISEGGEVLGLDVTEIPLDEERIVDNLLVDNPIICAMGPGDFTTSGHFVVMVGYEDGKLRINDPNSVENSGKLWELDQIRDQIRNLWVIRNG